MKKRILVFCEFYRPGFKGGGGMWTVANLVDRLGSEFEFAVVCRNHDGAGDPTAYTSVTTGQWNILDGQWVYPADPAVFTKRLAADIVDEYKPDAIFINSVFGLTTRMPMEARRKGWIRNVPVIIAPCGELSEQCLSIKPFKKAAFLRYAKLFGLLQGVTWKATSDAEAAEVRAQFGDTVRIETAPDLLPRSILPGFTPSDKPMKKPGRVRLVTVARIAPKKNIDYLLNRLADCRSGEFELEIVGGVDDSGYWRECEALIAKLPDNVTVAYRGAVTNSEVLERLVESHFFVLPTLNENFGYVFVEAMAAGCPLLISENTIWDRVERAGCGQVLRLDSPGAWVEALEQCARMDEQTYRPMSEAAREYALDWLRTSGDLESNRRIFESALVRGGGVMRHVERAR